MQEDIALGKSNTAEMTPLEMNENKEECAQVDNLFKALHSKFEEVSEQQLELSRQMLCCKNDCDEHQGTAKAAHARYEATLKEERRNLETLHQLDRESTFLHEMTLQQIKFCSDQVDYSREQTSGRIVCIQTEIQRLKELEKQETDRLQRLVDCKTQIDKVKKEEETLAKALSAELLRAKENVGERLKRADKGVKSSEDLLERIEALYNDVQDELELALSYGTELLKAIGVDCHTAFVCHGKFLAIQKARAEKNLIEFEETRKAKLQRSMELLRLQMPDVQATVDRADDAKRELDKAEDDVQQITDTIKGNKDKRRALGSDYAVVDIFLRKHACPATNGKLTVKTLPMAEATSSCSTVAEFREVRAHTTAVGHTLESLEAFETDFERRYRGEADGNLQTLFQKLNTNWLRGRLGY